MRFGTYSLPISLDPDSDTETIDQTLKEAELAEELGFDAVWLTEHHFNGNACYADPLVFGAAIAMRTKRVQIGFAVVQMALHHPVRLAVQSAIVDQLSKGRLLVGTGRGSGFSAFEYTGFGTDIGDGREMIVEAEDLLLRAWTGEDIKHEGKYWSATFPRLRPRPYQKPHPPLLRACASEDSTIEMAKIGRPVLFSSQSSESLSSRHRLYRETMLATGFNESRVEDTLNAMWSQKDIYIGETHQQAREQGVAASERQWSHIKRVRELYNPPEVGQTGLPDEATHLSARVGRANLPAEKLLDQSALLGTVDEVADQIAELRDGGIRNLMLKFNTGQMPYNEVERAMRSFQEKVAPRFTKAG